MRGAIAVTLLAAVVLLPGCGSRVPAARLAEEGGEVDVRLTTVAGEELEGTLFSLTSRRIVIDAVYAESEDVVIDHGGTERGVEVAGEAVEGQVLSVERTSEGRVTAVVRRSFAVREIASADFARTRRETALGTLLSQIVGPVAGILLGLLVRG